MAVIEGDYAKIQQYVMEGRAHELSESMTNYLGACTKGATAEKSMRDQSVYAPGVKARGRAWCYKGSYMNVVLNEYIVGESRGPRQEIGSSDEVIKDTEAVRVLGFDGYVLSLIEPYIGKTNREICDTFGLKYTGNKAQWTSIVYRMLGVKGNHAEEFSKANVSIRVVRAKANGRNQGKPFAFDIQILRPS